MPLCAAQVSHFETVHPSSCPLTSDIRVSACTLAPYASVLPFHVCQQKYRITRRTWVPHVLISESTRRQIVSKRIHSWQRVCMCVRACTCLHYLTLCAKICCTNTVSNMLHKHCLAVSCSFTAIKKVKAKVAVDRMFTHKLRIRVE